MIVTHRTVRSPPCSLCDYLFTLMLGMGTGCALWFVGFPWWLIVLTAHWQTASWFLRTRPWAVDGDRP